MSNEKERISILIDNIRHCWKMFGLSERGSLKVNYMREMQKNMEELETLSPSDYAWVKKEMDEKVEEARKANKFSLVFYGITTGLVGVAAIWGWLRNSDQ